MRKTKHPQELRLAVYDLYRKHASRGEFNKNDLLPEILALVSDYRRVASIDVIKAWDEQLGRLLLDKVDDTEAQPPPRHKGFFLYDEVVKVGEATRIKRRLMTAEHLVRHQTILDKNKRGQDVAYEKSSEWNSERLRALEGMPIGTVVEDVIDEDGNRVRKRSA